MLCGEGDESWRVFLFDEERDGGPLWYELAGGVGDDDPLVLPELKQRTMLQSQAASICGDEVAPALPVDAVENISRFVGGDAAQESMDLVGVKAHAKAVFGFFR